MTGRTPFLKRRTQTGRTQRNFFREKRGRKRRRKGKSDENKIKKMDYNISGEKSKLETNPFKMKFLEDLL